MTELQKLINKRSNIKGKLTRIHNFVQDQNNEQDISQLEVRLKETSDILDSFEQIQEQIELFPGTEVAVEDSAERQAFEDKYYTIRAQITTLIKGKNKVSSPRPSNHRYETDQNNLNTMPLPSINCLPTIPLPKITIPVFGGEIKEWDNFKSLFMSIVDSSTHISKVEKLYYLKSYLKGDASNLISSLPISSESYDNAIKILSEKYENKVLAVNQHLKIFNHPTVTGANLKAFLATLQQSMNYLNSMKVDIAELLVIFLMSQKLDNSLRYAWETSRKSNELPKLNDFITFLTDRCNALDILKEKPFPSIPQTKSSPNPNFNQSNKYIKTSHLSTDDSEPICVLCNSKHHLYTCKLYLDMSPQQRSDYVKNNNFCYNCLQPYTQGHKCSRNKCKVCFKRHHSTLHIDTRSSPGISMIAGEQSLAPTNPQFVETVTSQTSETIQNPSALVAIQEPPLGTILLCTAVVKLRSNNNNWICARALLDSGSQVNFIKRALAEKIQTPQLHRQMTIQGITNTTKPINFSTIINIASCTNNISYNLECLITEKITSVLPNIKIDISKLKIPQRYQLADPLFYIPKEIDILIGAELFFKIVQSETFTLGPRLPFMTKSTLGWLISGPAEINKRETQNSVSLCAFNVLCCKDILSKFWEEQDIKEPTTIIQSTVQQICENIYTNTTTRDDTGRFTVNIPINETKQLKLGNSFSLAYRYLLSMEAKFKGDATLHSQYKEFIQEYVELNHAHYIEDFNYNDNINTCYLPHHAVTRPEAISTKLRVVFNASARISSGLSVNDIQYDCPDMHTDIIDILIRFRLYKYAFSCDIIKMFRMIKVNNKQTQLQRILWRDSPHERLQCLELDTVTYGTKCAPYLAFRTLLELVHRDGHNFPLTRIPIKHQTYMDDVIYSLPDEKNAKQTLTQIKCFFESGGFKLHKWSTNITILREYLHTLYINEENNKTLFTEKDTTGILGMKWNHNNDTFVLQIPNQKITNITKRAILSFIAKIFDPLGLLGPIVIKAKIFIQTLWKNNLAWDESLPKDLHDQWVNYYRHLTTIQQITIPRLVLTEIPNNLTLIGFCDSSTVAYGACAYLLAQYPNKLPTNTLLIAKSRVAPIKGQTIPKLELCGALLLAILINKVKSILNVVCTVSDIHLFTDSAVVLYWLNCSNKNSDDFTKKRRSKILSLTDIDSWAHVNTKENPADLLTRGITSQELSSCQVWWQGPPWLLQERQFWPIRTHPFHNSNFNNLETTTGLTITEIQPKSHSELNDIFIRFSSYLKLQRCISYCYRFIHNTKSLSKTYGPLKVNELQKANIFIIKVIKSIHFSKEIINLNQDNNIFKSSPLRKLSPFIDSQGLLRVGGRLINAHIPHDHKHPIILPQKNHITKLIIRQLHNKLFHSGIQSTLANLRLSYWPINGRNEVKSVIAHCVICIRYRARTCEQKMANLPYARVNQHRPFLHTATDFTGHILIKSNRTRNSVYVKGYICLFICMATRAIHLELVSDLTAEAFILALKRLISRRGICHTIYSDNGSNFKRSNHELLSLYKMFHNDESYSKIISYSSQNSINWRFTVPLASHMGGIYEAGIKSAKNLLKRQLGTTKLPYEELNTILIQIEGILNSRPICALSDSPNDLTCLTPAHFLIGTSLMDIPEPDLSHVPFNRLSTFQKITFQKQQFWKQWKLQFLSELQSRPKWMDVKSNINRGDLVIIKGEETPPNIWPLGRVIETFKNKNDQLTRSASIKTEKGIFTRPIHKLILLPFN